MGFCVVIMFIYRPLSTPFYCSPSGYDICFGYTQGGALGCCNLSPSGNKKVIKRTGAIKAFKDMPEWCPGLKCYI